jgi:hypothetical protein
MDTTFITPDFIGRSIDAAIPLICGIIGFFSSPRQIAKRVKSGKMSAAEAKINLKKLKIGCLILMLFGLYLSVKLIVSLYSH